MQSFVSDHMCVCECVCVCVCILLAESSYVPILNQAKQEK